MSATNWAVCPNCLKRQAMKIKKKTAEVQAAYGVRPLEEFEAAGNELRALLREFEHWGDTTEHHTLREDYNGVGVDESGEFSIVYVADCSVCPFHYKYEFREQAFTEEMAEKWAVHEDGD